MSVSRRDLFRTVGAASAVAIAGSAAASEPRTASPEALGLLYDTTVCIGCKACVGACATANGLEPDTELSGGIWQMPVDLNPQTKNIIQLYRSPNGDESSFMKRQCMQCVDPACASACPFSALSKGKFGIVEWEPSRCIGCRFCEISCPFDVPRFEWAKFNPKIVKCELCRHRLPDGLQPACTEVCPVGAVIFGTREQLLREAHRRIEANPGKYYQNRVYGEHDLGGTQVVYLSHVPFAKLGLPEVGNESRAHYGEKVHGVLYKGMAVPAIVYAGLAFLMRRRFKVHEEEARHSGHEDQL
ncbi:MAG TPA: hydrogenase 2 operon protein HybA [Thermoanaerobaculia bacterium]|nr:hydrogenase 2 operon protein HybA [Thermoanaerobaculia bacterium]